MTVDDALRAAAGLLRQNAATVLPYYALLAAAVDVARVPLLAGAIVVYVFLASTGRLATLVDDLAGLNPELLSPEPGGVPPELSDRLATTLFSPTVVATMLAAGVGGVVCYVLARGVTRAAALAAVKAGVDSDDDRDPLATGVAGVGRWRTFAALVVVRWGLLVVAGVPVVAAVIAGAGTLGTADVGTALDEGAAVAILAALAGVIVTAAAVLVVLALLAFAGPAVVVDDVGVRGAVRRSAGVPFAHPGGFVLYGVVVVATYVVLGIGAAVLGVAGVNRVVALVSAFLVAPVLDGIAVALYVGWADDRESERSKPADTGLDADADTGEQRRAAATDESGFVFGPVGATEEADGSPESGDEWDDPAGADRGETQEESGDGRNSGGVVSGVRRALGGGIAELGGFVRRDWGYVLVAAIVLAVGIVAGWTATAGYGVRIGAPDDPGAVFGAVPVGPFVNISVNNWLVATHAGFSGLFAGVPTVATLLFNGLLVGAVAGVVEPLLFAALVAPHGIVELPAIAVAGGVGLRLGHVAWGTWRGARSRSALVDEIGRTWRVVVGLAVVFVVAGFVEAFVTPRVAAAVLG
ncbi:stage II sporulation protein M [Salinigranum marinum]|uniref:stage II sporulation protein M n=1 Tax=Salinigranum marinum TaxID=1515595 RepID=UPI002989E085|nr:stage II sporulation protein M [Salinigranum marinum]